MGMEMLYIIMRELAFIWLKMTIITLSRYIDTGHHQPRIIFIQPRPQKLAQHRLESLEIMDTFTRASLVPVIPKNLKEMIWCHYIDIGRNPFLIIFIQFICLKLALVWKLESSVNMIINMKVYNVMCMLLQKTQ